MTAVVTATWVDLASEQSLHRADRMIAQALQFHLSAHIVAATKKEVPERFSEEHSGTDTTEACGEPDEHHR